jgi:phosphoenolpyruvate carboxykinase (ATP)
MQSGRVNPQRRLEDVSYNLMEPALVQAALSRGRGDAGQGRCLSCARRASSPAARPRTSSWCAPLCGRQIWWDNNAPMAPDAFDRLYADMLEHMQGRDYFVQDLYGGADPAHRLDVRVVTELAWHGLFIRHCCAARARRAGQLRAGMDHHQLPQLQGRSRAPRLPHRYGDRAEL